MSSNPNYDSELCGKVPIHLINTVQPYGVLLVLSRKTYEVIQASENVASLFDIAAPDLINTSIGNHIDPIAFDSLKHMMSTAVADKIPKVWTIHSQQHFVVLHIKPEYILAEIDLAAYQEEQQRSFIGIYQEIKYSMSLIEGAKTTTGICTIAARELKRISGFDKVMIYRFDPEWNGTVIAEERESDMESYYGFTFPASDIPRQARDLYLRNPYRFIPDRDYQPVKLFPVINPVTNSFIDLSDCNLRGIASVHLEYLANMGVTASMSARILHNDKLWGLIACHHKTARHLSFELCSIFELLSNFISSRMHSLQNKERHDADTQKRDIHARLLEQVYQSKDIKTGLLTGDTTVMQLFGAQGAVITHNGHLRMEGSLPDIESIEELLLWLHTRGLTHSLYTDNLSSQFDRAAAYMNVASGLLAIPFHPEQEYLLLFRPEVKRVIHWGGDPGGRIVFEKDGLNYHPRHSFKQWQQTVDGTSLPWREEELTAAETLRSFLYEYTSKQI